VLGTKGKWKCPSCGADALTYKRRLDEQECIPAGLCEKCETEDREMKEAVAQGGVFWRCADCNSGGVIKAGVPLAEAVREQYGIGAPDPVGVEFTKNDCPVCGPNPVEKE